MPSPSPHLQVLFSLWEGQLTLLSCKLGAISTLPRGVVCVSGGVWWLPAWQFMMGTAPRDCCPGQWELRAAHSHSRDTCLLSSLEGTVWRRLLLPVVCEVKGRV